VTSGVNLSHEIEEHHGITVSMNVMNIIRKRLCFKCQPPRHNQALAGQRVEDRVSLCGHMLGPRYFLPVIHISDKTRFVLCDNRHWMCYRKGEENPSASLACIMLASSPMLFTFIRPGGSSPQRTGKCKGPHN
jgi:hypothetical protein